MTIFIIVIHVIACIALIGLVLIQRGRGSGLVDSFQGVESILGTKTNEFLTRSTTVFSVIFFVTCLSLAFLSAKQNKSLMADVKQKKSSSVSLPAVDKVAPPENKTEDSPAQPKVNK